MIPANVVAGTAWYYLTLVERGESECYSVVLASSVNHE